jgi:hypothetical protein
MFTITDTEVNPSSVLSFKGVRVDSTYAMADGVCEILTIHSDETQSDIETNYDTWKAEYKTAEENKVDHKANAKAKLIAGEALTEDEANTIVL